MYTSELYIQQFNEAKTELNSLTNELSEQDFLKKPGPDQWSVAEIISHLNVTGNTYLESLKAKNEENSVIESNIQEPYKHGFVMKKFIDIVGPASKKKVSTFKVLNPGTLESLEKHHLIEEFNNLQDEFIQIVKNAQQHNIHLEKTKLSNPIFPIIKMNMSASLAITLAHQKRHFDQIRNTIG